MFILQLIITTALCAQPGIHFEKAHTELDFDEPIQVLFDGVHADQMYVVEKKGVVQQMQLGDKNPTTTTFLDIKDRVQVGHSEEGLLSVVFHPNYKFTKKIFVWYTAHKPRRCVLSSITISNTENEDTVYNEEVILEVAQPWGNHNGGTLLFGEDGYLYVGVGDGGGSNDRKNNGQNKKTLLGTIIRIDINKKEGDKNYSIPEDNPFVKESNARSEIWAYGLRNPWRMSFDRKTGALWAADVGQNAWEEIDIIERGKNYGWNLREGKHDFKKNNTKTTDPVFEYGRRQGGSITGGYVYRGKEIPTIDGEYIFSDYLSGRTWRLSAPKDSSSDYTAKRILNIPPISISSFGETPTGEILACGFDSPYATKGKIYLLVPADRPAESSSSTESIR
ncbi:MAG: PQQ-dependent sugar dehydrogenase [Planctomycetes bacterium]|nr:PQQ-dependent sugar dehydrogenase [Planctomycetota bacterium]